MESPHDEGPLLNNSRGTIPLWKTVTVPLPHHLCDTLPLLARSPDRGRKHRVRILMAVVVVVVCLFWSGLRISAGYEVPR